MCNKGLIPPILALMVLATASVATGISQLDINDGQLIYDYEPGSNPRSDVEGWITTGFNDAAQRAACRNFRPSSSPSI